MSAALALSERTLGRIVDGVGAVERLTDGRPALDAGDPAKATGVMRVFDGPTGSAVDQVVWTMLQVPARGVTTCMIFAFTRPSSPIPHFTLDCSDHGDGMHAFHLDLAPRVELATHVDYMDAAFDPLSDAFATASAVDGLSATRTTRRQFAMMSPWMLVHLATPAAFDAIGGTVDAYVEHWLSLVDRGLPAEVTSALVDDRLADRDRQFRQNLFSPAIDPVWGRVDGMIGPDAADVMRRTLVGE
jgi:hypothetical protein